MKFNDQSDILVAISNDLVNTGGRHIIVTDPEYMVRCHTISQCPYQKFKDDIPEFHG